MAKKYAGSLSLSWFNKQKSILLQEENARSNGEIPAPKVNWVNKDEALFYEIVDEEGRGLSPYWVDRSDLRVKESRPLVLQKTYQAVEKAKAGSLIEKEYALSESEDDDPAIRNLLIRGDNLLALNALKKLFASRLDEEKVKCVYIDLPYNTGSAFEHYDDNLEHSEWLTLVRDRVVILRDLLRDDGSLFVQIDQIQLAYLKILLDEVFGRDNFVIQINWQRASQRSVLGQGATPLINIVEYVLVYVKNAEHKQKSLTKIDKVYPADEKLFAQYDRLFSINGERTLVKEILHDGTPIEIYVHPNATVETIPAANKNLKFYLDNFDRIGRKHDQQEESSLEQKILSHIEKDGQIYSVDRLLKQGKRKGLKKTTYYRNENVLLHLKDYGEIIENKIYRKTDMNNLWLDYEISAAGIGNEGGVELKRSKKPESLIERILRISTDENDLVLDCFGGSGTTLAACHKMKRQWIGVEIGKHAETHIIPRLKKVLTGEDQSGISKHVNWHGGGSFKYYKLGGSIIDSSTRDFNWELGRDFIEKSLLSSYDFAPDSLFSLPQAQLIDATRQPSIGFHRVGQRQMACVVSLEEPHEDKPITYDEFMAWYDALKKFGGTQAITIFTNRGVEIAYDSKPEDLEVIKVPHAIFAELEK